MLITSGINKAVVVDKSAFNVRVEILKTLKLSEIKAERSFLHPP
jgi:hypothetical protein